MCTPILKLQKATLDSYEEGMLVPHFALTLKLKDTTSPQSLVQQIAFTGLQKSTSFTLLRDPKNINEGLTDLLALLVLKQSVHL